MTGSTLFHKLKTNCCFNQHFGKDKQNKFGSCAPTSQVKLSQPLNRGVVCSHQAEHWLQLFHL